MSTYSDLQIDALRELANIGSGNAATALGGMLGRSIDISVPNPLVLPLPEAVEAVGAAEDVVTGVAIPVRGELDATVVMLFGPQTANVLTGLLGLEAGGEYALSAVSEIGNILGASYLGALAAMTGLTLEPAPPQAATDMLAAIMTTVLLGDGHDREFALLLDSKLSVEGEECSPTFLFIPSAGGIDEMLGRLGLAS